MNHNKFKTYEILKMNTDALQNLKTNIEKEMKRLKEEEYTLEARKKQIAMEMANMKQKGKLDGT